MTWTPRSVCRYLLVCKVADWYVWSFTKITSIRTEASSVLMYRPLTLTPLTTHSSHEIHHLPTVPRSEVSLPYTRSGHRPTSRSTRLTPTILPIAIVALARLPRIYTRHRLVKSHWWPFFFSFLLSLPFFSTTSSPSIVVFFFYAS